jgi:hypothetical protein
VDARLDSSIGVGDLHRPRNGGLVRLVVPTRSGVIKCTISVHAWSASSACVPIVIDEGGSNGWAVVIGGVVFGLSSVGGREGLIIVFVMRCCLGRSDEGWVLWTIYLLACAPFLEGEANCC